MGKINFREDVFRGTLVDLLEQCKLEFAHPQSLRSVHEWLRIQLCQPNNILPVRKSSEYPFRGSLQSIGDSGCKFMPVDNEPLADLYRRWMEGAEVDGTIGAALTKGSVVASWQCDQRPQAFSAMRFKGVKTRFRDRGLKLAHISDAARRVPTDLALPEQIAVRFLRTLSPFNVFLFPSGRCCEFRLISCSSGWHPRTADWAEDLELRKVALGWLIEWQGSSSLDALADFRSELKPNPDWLKIAQGTVVEVRPKGEDRFDVETEPRSKPLICSTNSERHAFPKVSKVSAVVVPEAVELLRSWRASYPLATELDGRNGNNPAHWLHIRVEGYGDKDSFTSRYGPTFRGEDYNGVVNFHGDTATLAIDRFIELIDLADEYRDVLRPSATYETKSKPKKDRVRPKFALQGYKDRIEGFFLYHDEWQ